MNKHWPFRKTKYAHKRRRPIRRLEYSHDLEVEIAKGGEIMAVLASLLRESVLVQGAITMALVVTTCYLWMTGQDVPDRLWTADTIVLGVFFGAKAQHLATRMSTYRKG
jgi:hypothetical protein